MLHEGEVSRRFYFVCKGAVRIYFIQDEGQEATRYLAFENHFASALQSLISEEPSMEYIQALEESRLLYISRNDFKHLLSVVPEWERFYRKYLEKAYVVNTNRLMSFITMSAEQRYRAMTEQNHSAAKRLPGRIIASYLNISQETLSRIKTRLSEE